MKLAVTSFLRGLWWILRGRPVFPYFGGGRLRKSWDVAVGGLWEEDIEKLKHEWPDHEIVEVVSEDSHHYTAYLRRKR